MDNVKSLPIASRRFAAWLIIFVAAGLVFSLGLACAVPLAAFASYAARKHGLGPALILVGSVWFTNQCAGFTVLGYPHDLPTIGWGAALGVVAIAATVGAAQAAKFTQGVGAAATAFAASFFIYEGGLWLLTLSLGQDTDVFALETVARIFAINAATFAALLLAGGFVRKIGVSETHPVKGIA